MQMLRNWYPAHPEAAVANSCPVQPIPEAQRPRQQFTLKYSRAKLMVPEKRAAQSQTDDPRR